MTQKTSPWLESKYGWTLGEDNWNGGMDENLLKFSFMFDRNVDSIAASLPPVVDGQAHYLTTDNRLYFATGATYFSTPVPKWFVIVDRSTGQTYQYNGTSLVQVDTPVQLETELANTTDKTLGVAKVGGAQRTVANIAALAALGAGVSSVNVLHRTNTSDLGGGAFDWVAGNQSVNVTADPLQGVWVAPTSDITGSSGAYKRVYTYLDFRYFGADDTGTSDAAPAIQATYDYAKFLGKASIGDLRGGTFKIGSTVNIKGNRITSTFAGENLTRFTRNDGNFGSTFKVSPDDPTTEKLTYFVWGRCSIESSVEMNSGSHIEMISCQHCTIFDQHWWNGYKSFSFSGLQNAFIYNTKVDTGAFYGALKVGSRFVEALAPVNLGSENTEVFFSDFNWTFTINAYTEIGLDLREADGIWFSNGHIFGADTDCRIAPSSTSTQTFGFRFSNVWFDGFCQRNLYILSNSTSGYGLITLSNCVFSGANGSYAIEVTAGATDLAQVNFTGGFIGNCQGAYVSLNQGDYVTFNGVQMADGNRAANPSATAFVLGAGCRKVNISNCQIGTPNPSNTFLKGIDVQGTNVEALINNNNFTNCTDEIALSGNLGLSSKIMDNTTSRATYTNVAAGVTIALPSVAENINLTGASANVTTLNYGWEGRDVILRAVTNSQTIVNATGNILTNTGANIVLTAGRTIRLTYNVSASAWIQSL